MSVPGSSALPSNSIISYSTVRCCSRFPALPNGWPRGQGTNIARGGLSASVISLTMLTDTVAMPLPFHRVLNQPDRAIAKPSRGREQRHLRPRLAQPPSGRRRRLLHQSLHEFLVDVAHEAHVHGRDPAYRALGGHLGQALVRVDDVQVHIRPPVVVIIVRYRERIARGVARNLAKRGVAVGVFHVEGGLILQVHPARRHQRHFAFAHGLRRRRPWREPGPRAIPGHLGGEIPVPRPSFHQPRIPRQKTRRHPVLPPAQIHRGFLSVGGSSFGGGHLINQRRTLSQRGLACTRREGDYLAEAVVERSGNHKRECPSSSFRRMPESRADKDGNFTALLSLSYRE